MFHNIELEFITFIHQYRTPLLDGFFKFLNYFDRQEFLFVLLPIIWLCNGWRTGYRLFYLLLINSFVNYALKQIFLSPRPFHLDPSVGVIEIGGLGFPSGAAQTVIILSVILLYSGKGWRRWILALSYVGLISFSRIYLGAHFPTDILAGWTVGFGIVTSYYFLYPRIEKQLEKFNPNTQLILSLIIPIVIYLAQNTIGMHSFCGVAMGMGIGLYIANLYSISLPKPQNWKEYILRGLFGVIGTFACYLIGLNLLGTTSFSTALLIFVVIGLWLSLGSTFIWSRLLHFSPRHRSQA